MSEKPPYSKASIPQFIWTPIYLDPVFKNPVLHFFYMSKFSQRQYPKMSKPCFEMDFPKPRNIQPLKTQKYKSQKLFFQKTQKTQAPKSQNPKSQK